MARSYIRCFRDIGIGDVASVGGKNASLGEMVRNLGRHGIKVPPGFATTADGYRHFIASNDLERLIESQLASSGRERPPSPSSVQQSGLPLKVANGLTILRKLFAVRTGICRDAWE